MNETECKKSPDEKHHYDYSLMSSMRVHIPHDSYRCYDCVFCGYNRYPRVFRSCFQHKGINKK